MIIHIFKLTTFHLNKTLIKAMHKVSSNISEISPYFLIYGSFNEMEVRKHIELFKQSRITNYDFAYNPKMLYQFAIKNRQHSFLLHGTTYACMCILAFAGVKLNWVCWGAGASINKRNWKSILFTPFKILIYHRFRNITTLMVGDKVTLEHDFGLKGIEVLPYYPYNKVHFKDRLMMLNKTSVHREKLAVLLGNSAHCIDSYYELLGKLSRFKGLVTINCMMQYPQVDKRTLSDLKNKGEAIFGKDSFFCDTEMLGTEAYFAYISKFDIYVCGKLRQSGLGAANTSIMLGKKVFLTGKNLQWMRSSGLFVYDLNDIEKGSDSDFFTPLTEEQKKLNFDKEYADVEEITNKWIQYLHKIAKK